MVAPDSSRIGGKTRSARVGEVRRTFSRSMSRPASNLTLSLGRKTQVPTTPSLRAAATIGRPGASPSRATWTSPGLTPTPSCPSHLADAFDSVRLGTGGLGGGLDRVEPGGVDGGEVGLVVVVGDPELSVLPARSAAGEK